MQEIFLSRQDDNISVCQWHAEGGGEWGAGTGHPKSEITKI